MEEIIKIYNKKIFAWWVDPATKLNNLKQYLLAQNFKKETIEYAMF